MQKALQFVFKADLVVRDRQKAGAAESSATQDRRHTASRGGKTIGPVSEIAGKKFVGALSGEDYGYVFAAHLSQEPCRQRSGIGAGLVRVVGNLLDGAFQVGGFIQIKFRMLAAKVARDFRDGFALIEGAAFECDGEGAQLRAARLRRVAQ